MALDSGVQGAGAELIPVRFLVGNSPYGKGEVAGLTPKQARRVVDRKVAEPYDEKAKKALDKKAPKRPPRDKMIRGNRTVQKG